MHTGYRNEYQISTYSPVGTPGYRNEYQIPTYSPVGTPGYRNAYQISTYSPVGTPGYRNEYQISTYSPVGTPGLGINSLPAARYIILQDFSQIVCVWGGIKCMHLQLGT